MPRIATQESREVKDARTLLAAYLERDKHSESQLSKLSGVPQYTISKFLTGRIKSLTPDVRKFLVFANNGITQGANLLTDDPRIQRALGSAWDGTDQGVALIASAINALAPVLRDAQAKPRFLASSNNATVATGQ